jgi:hypothetical protein
MATGDHLQLEVEETPKPSKPKPKNLQRRQVAVSSGKLIEPLNPKDP